MDITLRAPEPTDLDMLYLWENDTDEQHSTLRTGPTSRHQLSAYLNNYDGDIFNMGGLRYIIELPDKTPVGTIDIYDFERRARHAFVAIYIATAYRHRHIATQALNTIHHKMADTLGMHSLCAIVAADNIPSQILFNKAGYKHAGTLRQWINTYTNRIDALLLQKILEPV